MSNPHALPKYVQTAEMLIREIASGRLLDGERLPPEREMASELGLSVGTLRKALEDLETRGLLERRQGSGNYIRTGDAGGVYALFRLELIGGGGLPTAEVLSVDLLPKPHDAPEFGPGPKAHRIRRLRRLGGTPAALEEIWLDGSRAKTIAKMELSESLYLFYRHTLGFWIARAEDSISVGPAPEWSAPPFGAAPGATCGYVERLGRDQDGRAAEFSRTWFDTSVARYVSRLR
ncbi:MAG: GntR family transcriptional regulator [Pseudomonadota bacterium]